MAPSRSVRSPFSAFKRLRIAPSPSPPCLRTPTTAANITTTARNNASEAPQEGVPADIQTMIQQDLFDLAGSRNISLPPTLLPTPDNPARPPRALTALHRAPPRRPSTHNIPTATLQLRSYSARNLETMADFALRAAYYLQLPARGPVPLPRITERWTVPRSVFVHKKAQENWERITMRRLIQIVDGDGESVRRWLAFIRRWCWYGVGMKANVWEYEGLETSKEEVEDEIAAGRRQSDWELFGRRGDLTGTEAVGQYMDSLGFAADENVKTNRKPRAKKEAATLEAGLALVGQPEHISPLVVKAIEELSESHVLVTSARTATVPFMLASTLAQEAATPTSPKATPKAPTSLPPKPKKDTTTKSDESTPSRAGAMADVGAAAVVGAGAGDEGGPPPVEDDDEDLEFLATEDRDADNDVEDVEDSGSESESETSSSGSDSSSEDEVGSENDSDVG